MKQILTIAGSDSGGGAGIQADLKSIHANGGYGLSVITSVTAQNTREVTRAFDLPTDLIDAQIDAIFSDFDVAALKTGMLSSVEIVGVVAEKLREHSPRNIVIDPVTLSKSKYPLLRPDAVECLKTELLPLATVVMPNVDEAELLAKCEVQTIDDAKAAAKLIQDTVVRACWSKEGIFRGKNQPMCYTLMEISPSLRQSGLKRKTHTARAVPTPQQLPHTSGLEKTSSLPFRPRKITSPTLSAIPLTSGADTDPPIISTS